MADDKYPPAPVTYTDQSGQHFSRVDEMSDAPERVWLDELDKCHPDIKGECACGFRSEVVYRRFLQMEAENARLREKLSAFEGALTVEVAKTEAARRLVHEIGAEGLMAENARLREALEGNHE